MIGQLAGRTSCLAVKVTIAVYSMANMIVGRTSVIHPSSLKKVLVGL